MEGKLKYYFKKPKGEIVKDILLWVALAGAISVAATSPYFIRNVLRAWKKGRAYKIRSMETAFQRLRKEGIIAVEKKRHEYSISLTPFGKKKAGIFQIDSLKIERPRRWDGKWRLLMFDVAQTQRWKRDVLRSFIRRLGFLQFQKSVWLHPFNCKAEVELLQQLLDLTSQEIKLVLSEDLGEDEERLRKKFNVSQDNQ